MKQIVFAFALGFAAAAFAEGHAISAVQIPEGGYFDTGVIPSVSPRVRMKYAKNAEKAAELDVFGTNGRKAGSFLLTDANGQFSFTYGASGQNKAYHSLEPGDWTFIDCSVDLYVEGGLAKTATNTGNFSDNKSETMCFPGSASSRRKAISIGYFIFENDGVTYNFRPWVEDGVVGFKDMDRGTFLTMQGSTATPATETTCPNECEWTGAAGDGKWSTAGNWKDNAGPTCTYDDWMTIDIGSTSTAMQNDLTGVKFKKMTVKGVNDKVLTLTGNPISFCGTSSGNTVICTNTCSVDVSTDFTINGSGKMVFAGPSTIYRGDINVVGENTLKFFGRPAGASAAGANGYSDLIGNNVTTKFYGTVGGDQAKLYVSVGANGNGTPIYFYAPVVCRTLLLQTDTKPCGPHFCASGNRIADLAFFASNVYADTDNVFTEDTVFDPRLELDTSWIWNGIFVFQTGSEQVLNRLIGASEAVYRGKGKNFAFNLTVGDTGGNTSNAATLTLRNTADAVTHMRLCDALNVVLDAKGDYVQAFEDRVHPTKGTIEVKRGTFRTCGTNAFLNVSKVVVRSGATLEIASTNAVHAAFNALTQLVVEDGGRVVVASADVNAFPASTVGAYLAPGAKVVIPAGANVKFGRLAVGDAELEANDYSGEAWIEGTGSATVSGSAAATSAIWWRPVSGAWTDGANWLSGTVPTSSDSVLLNAEGAYTVTYGAAATKPTKITVGAMSGAVKLKVDGDVSFDSGTLEVLKNGTLEIPSAASLNVDGSPTITVNQGELAVNGGALVVTNFGGTFTVGGTVSHTGRVTAVGGTISYHTSGNKGEKLISLEDNSEMTLSANSVYQSWRQGQMAVRMMGGRFLSEDSLFVGWSNNWHFAESEMVFSGTSALTNNSTSHSLFVYPHTDGKDVHLALRDHASFVGNRFDTMLVGDDNNGTSAAADTVVDLDSDRVLKMGQKMISYGSRVGSPKGHATLNLWQGWFNIGQRGLRVGAAYGSRYGTLPTVTGFKGTLNIYGGAMEVPSCSVTEGHPTGLIIGDGTPINASVRENYKLFEGWYNQTGGVMTNRCNLLVGGPRSRGTFTLTGGEYRSQSEGYPFIVGAAGGTGTCLLGGGTAVVKSYAYVGGVFTNAIPHGNNLDYGLANYGWPLDNHSAVGTLTVTGGVVTFEKDLGVGFDGAGTVAVEGSLATIGVNGDLVLSNTVATATSSTLKFKFDENGVSPIDVRGKLVNTAGTKVEVDMGDYEGRKSTFRLVSCGNAEGPALSKDDVTITGDQAKIASCVCDSTGIRLCIVRGTVVILK